jgi:acyl-CoA thioesterase-1
VVKCAKDSDGAGGTAALVDGHYGNWGFWGTGTSNLPDSCAIQVGKGPNRLMLVWESGYVFDYVSDTGMTPQDYTISTSADSTDGSDGTWKTVATITGNQTRVREHVFDFAGQSWVKMTATKGQEKASQPYIRIDEIDLFDVSASLDQTFFFSGDSITGMAYTRFDANQPSFPELVHQSYPQYYPAMLNGGMGGWNSGGAVEQMDLWLSLNPDMHYWLLGWGTNDAAQNVPAETFRANLQTLIDKVKQAGHIPVVAHVPYMKKDAVVDQLVQSYNDQIDQLTSENGLIPGPDLYQVTHNQASAYLLPDGVHPTDAGGIALTRAWFNALRGKALQ